MSNGEIKDFAQEWVCSKFKPPSKLNEHFSLDGGSCF